MKQPEALRLARELDDHNASLDRKCAAELRRLHEVNVELLDALQDIVLGSRLDAVGNRNDDGLTDNGGGYGFTKRINSARAAIAKAQGEKT